MPLVNDNHIGTIHDDVLDTSRDISYASVAEVQVGDAIRAVSGPLAHCSGKVVQVCGEDVMANVHVFGHWAVTWFTCDQIVKVG